MSIRNEKPAISLSLDVFLGKIIFLKDYNPQNVEIISRNECS